MVFVEDVVFGGTGTDGAIPGEHDFPFIESLHFTRYMTLRAFEGLLVWSASPSKQKETNRGDCQRKGEEDGSQVRPKEADGCQVEEKQEHEKHAGKLQARKKGRSLLSFPQAGYEKVKADEGLDRENDACDDGQDFFHDFLA
jgi:hypothetical protein